MRVIGGSLRGRELRAPKGVKTRPTTDKVREAWFNILGDIAGASVLELYAGTGALGIEALSRNAARAVFVEAWGPAQKTLAENLQQLGLQDRSTLVKSRVENALKRLRDEGPFDLVLADPPWTDLEHSVVHIKNVMQSDLLLPGARIYVGHPRKFSFVPPPRDGLDCVDQRAWGDSGASLFVWSTARHD